MGYGNTKEYKRDWIKKWRHEARRKGLCGKCTKNIAESGLAYCFDCRIKHKVITNTNRMKMRRLAIEYYGNKCIICGESRYPCLEFDHVNNDGAEHREVIARLYLPTWLKKNNYPENIIQILCSNCHRMKHYEDGMRHKMRGSPE